MIRRVLLVLALGVGGAWIVRNYIFEAVSVATGSMEPTLDVDTHYLVLRSAYWFHGPARGDIISFVSPVDGETPMIKRVIAIAGDQIEMRHKQVILNGEPVTEPYAIHKRANDALVGDDIGPLTVPSHALFVLGDNRDVSDDSTVWHDAKTGQPLYFLSTAAVRGRLVKF